ncbi:VOC family protein [Mucilaginibacter auburnensis]|uniref:Putative 3-demethylubiquinone-9 3-methyltransferase (Glyoxalase superfamily) n=1 Tax=Mucilaginibacter auburnensis TaxID=1457233 RepID=A0A2H9VV69_9SPHI|nr:VOC family protein [Mucilaginibacter auburnensis]PJJ84716.1 putative 3-demethylubiquinone-9 3-methyltransferase (glyoxalase superfamily) [Mucilaginibacter auburnensis]
MQKITPFLWFDNNAEEAINFYVSVFKDAKIGSMHKMGDKLLTASFTINGQEFMVLNGGPMFKFNESVSFFVKCADQAEVDYLWDTLTADGGQPSQCGWLKDKYGLSWQIVPQMMETVLWGPNNEGAKRAMNAMMQMSKLDMGKLQEAYNG